MNKPLSTPRVVVATPIYGWVPAEAAMSFATMIACGVKHNLVCGLVQDHFGLLSQARNYIVANCINAKYQIGANNVIEATHVLFVDSDMVLPNDVIQQLGKHNKPVVSALYFERKPPFYPVFRMDREVPKNRPDSYPDSLFEAQHIGMGCALIEMSVLKRIQEHTKQNKWFAFENDEGEDIYFSRRCHELNIPIHVDPKVVCGHVGQIIVTDHHWKNRAAIGGAPVVLPG